MNEAHEAVKGETGVLPESQLVHDVPASFIDVRCDAGELLDDEWAAEFDRRLAAWQTDALSAIRPAANSIT